MYISLKILTDHHKVHFPYLDNNEWVSKVSIEA